MQPLVHLVVFVVIAVCIGMLVQWLIGFLGTPSQPAKLLTVIVWVIIGAACIVRLLTFAGIY